MNVNGVMRDLEMRQLPSMELTPAEAHSSAHPSLPATGSLMARRQAGFRHISKSSRQVWSICPGRDSLGRPTGLSTQGCLAKKQPDGQDHSRGSELGARTARVGGPGLRK